MQLTAQDSWDALLCEVNSLGTRRWVDADGKLHRENGPALIHRNGNHFWYKHGKLHHENGPAFNSYSGYTGYWIDGIKLTEEQFNARKLTVNGRSDIILVL